MMDGDGDILGTRRRAESPVDLLPSSAMSHSAAAAAGFNSAILKSSPGGSMLSQHTHAGSGADGRHGGIVAGSLGSPLKRQRSMTGVSAAGEPEETTGGHAAGVVPVDQLTPEQLKRFQAWKRSRFERDDIRELVTDRAAPTLIKMLEGKQGTGVVRETTTIAVGAVAKMFVGDIVEEAKRAQLEKGEEGPLRPKDLLEARERMARDGRGPPLQPSSATARERGRAGGGRLPSRSGARLVKGNAI